MPDAKWVSDAVIANQGAREAAATAAQGPGSKSVKILDQKHPEYVLKLEAWIDLKLLVEGGVLMRKKAERILKKRPREDPEVYNARRERFTYQNILGTALGWYLAAMFKDDPQFFFLKKDSTADLDKSLSSFYKDRFLMNCDGNNTKFVEFMKQEYANILTYGESHVLTDLPPLDPDRRPVTLQEEQEMGYRAPFLVSYTPIEVINWKRDRAGAYEWVVIKTTKLDQSTFDTEPEEIDTWYYFDRQNFKIYEDRKRAGSVSVPSDSTGRYAKLIGEGQHALANVRRVPLRSLKLSNELWLANRSYLLLIDHVNQDNTLAWSLFMSNLAIPVIIGDVDVSNMQGSEVGYYQFPAGTEYKWTEPEGKSFQASAQRLESLREEAFRCMYLQSQGMSTRSTPQMQSGRSKLVSMVPTHEVLASMADDLRSAMQLILGDVRDARREVSVEPDVRGLDYEDDMTTEEVFAVTSLLNMRIPSETFERYIYKKVVKAWARDANQKALETMYTEIESGPTMEDRADEDLKKRMMIAAAGMKGALSGKSSGGGLIMPPGRGGGGPSMAPPVDSMDQNSATI